MLILNRIDKELKEESKAKETQYKEYFYGQTVAASIRNLGDMEKYMIKHEINNILFKYQMNMYNAQNTSSTSQRIAYPTPTNLIRFSAVTSNNFNWQHSHASNSSQASHMTTDPLCNQITHLTNMKRKSIFFMYIQRRFTNVQYVKYI